MPLRAARAALALVNVLFCVNGKGVLIAVLPTVAKRTQLGDDLVPALPVIVQIGAGKLQLSHLTFLLFN